jgi:dephospho-CoA kinase
MLIGLTGGIASGKSTVSEIWKRLGAEIVDADEVARDVVGPGSAGLAAVVKRFGSEVLNEEGVLNRQKLGELIFANESARKNLEGILHPLIRAESQRRFEESKAPHVVYAIPLLAENRGEYVFDRICTISAPREVRLARLMADRGYTKTEAERRLDSQASDAQRESIADVVIDSNCTLQELEIRATAAWRDLTGDGNPTDGA